MKKTVAITVLISLIVSFAVAFVPRAYADPPWVLVYDMSGNVCDKFFLGDSINVTAICCTRYLPFNITITAPNGTVVYTKTGVNANSWTAIFSNMTDAVGDWLIELIGTGGTVHEGGYASGSYFVIPQVPLGVIATLSACLAGFGIKRIRKRKT